MRTKYVIHYVIILHIIVIEGDVDLHNITATKRGFTLK